MLNNLSVLKLYQHSNDDLLFFLACLQHLQTRLMRISVQLSKLPFLILKCDQKLPWTIIG